jgi:hypothetical protein
MELFGWNYDEWIVVEVQGMDVVKAKEMAVDFGAGKSLRYFAA